MVKTEKIKIALLWIFHLLSIAVAAADADEESEMQRYRTHADYIIENGLQGSEREVQLEDFFWTGSGDGPPTYVRSDDSSKVSGGTIIKTATVLATVYVDGSMENLDPLCTFDCDNYEVNSVETMSPVDRRYWLLTVVGGFFGPSDFPILEEKLAKLYRIAFTRQQAKHLGLVANGTRNASTIAMERIKRDTQAEVEITPSRVFTQQVGNGMYLNRNVLEFERSYVRRKKRGRKRRGLQVPNTITTNMSSLSFEGERSNYQNILIERRQNRRKVTVKIHNVTHFSEDETRRAEEKEDAARSHFIGNQTEIIYSVFVSGKPVLATTAAKDMELLTVDEVGQIMEHPIPLKAEPYLKEPQATPLVPAQANSGLIEALGRNPWWLVALCVIMMLIVGLLVGLLMMTKAKRKRSAELKQLVSSHHGTVSPIHHHHHHLEPSKSPSQGLENSAFSKDESTLKSAGELPVIHFPLPPPISRPTSSSSSTSDSSIYYSKRRNRNSLQELLDDKAAQLFRKKTCKHENPEEGKKKETKASKQKRKYLNENKVGSVEEVQVQCHSPPTTSSSDFGVEEVPNNDHISNYHKNKLLHDSKFLDRSDDDTAEEHFSFGRHRHHHETDETGSIGSYLSMISIRSFPKSMVPEPLSKVLEPSVSVTYLDQSSDPDDFLRSSKALEPVIREDEEDGEADEKKPTEVKPSEGPTIYKLQSSAMSPIRDPVQTRNRFEGLLEGAIQMFTAENGGADTPEIASSAAIYASKIRENRGKSALPFRNPAILKPTGGRPFTAGTSSSSPKKSQPPSPSRAWASGAHSPLVRPMSAGPFHRPPTQAPVVDVTRVLAPRTVLQKSDLSAAPLIEAIQNELKKFNKN